MKRNYCNACIIASIFVMLFAPIVSNQVVNAAPVQSISLVKSGLVASDPLNNQNKTREQLRADPYWRFGGSAAEQNAPFDFFQDAQGMHIGVKANTNGTWAGYYAISPVHDTRLFHAVITTPVRTIPSTNNLFVNGIYVQTTQPYINYIACVSNTSTSGTVWTVGHSYSSPFTSIVVEQLWVDTSPNQPLTRECTIITNGDNYLKVYVDGVMVYSNNNLKLLIPSPFNFFLEPQNNYADQMLYGTYIDYYTTSDETIQITNNPSNAATVKLVSPQGIELASAPVNSGTAKVDVGKYHFPLVANITVYDSSDTLIASTSSPADIFGGDVYSYTTSVVTPPQPPTGLNAVAVSSSQINLSWNAPSDNGGSPITGYMIERSLDSGTTWSTIAANTNSTTTAYSDTGLSPATTYTYRVSALNSAGTSSPSNIASATTPLPTITSQLTVTTQKLNGADISGLWIELYQNDVLIDEGFSPKTFTLQSGQTYTVVPGDWVGYFFHHWLDTGSTNRARDISVSSDTTITAVYQTVP